MNFLEIELNLLENVLEQPRNVLKFVENDLALPEIERKLFRNVLESPGNEPGIPENVLETTGL